MASSKSYDLYLCLALFVILFTQVFSHTLPETEATNPAGRKVTFDGRMSMQDFMRAVHFLESRTRPNMDAPPRLTEPKKERNVDVKASEGEMRTFPAAAYPWMKNDNVPAKTGPAFPGRPGNRRLLENFATEEEIKVLQLPN